jgi:hypothetical protein
MADHDPMPAPETPEWTVAYALRQLLRRHLGPKHGYVPGVIAREIVAALRLSKWRLIKEPPNPPHSGPSASHVAAVKQWQEERRQGELDNGIEPRPPRSTPGE